MDNLSFFLGAPTTRPFIYILLVADLILRGISLYKSARKDQKVWFVALLVVNSLGILPLIYLFLNRAKTVAPVAVAKKTTKKKSKK